MKVFGIGLSRTGTKSLTIALMELGLDAVHFPHDNVSMGEVLKGSMHLSIADSKDAIIDEPLPLYYKSLYLMYPKSKFILTVRPIQDWLKSSNNLWSQRLDHVVSSHLNLTDYIKHMKKKIYGIIGFEEEIYRKVYTKYVFDVMSFFKNDADRLLVMNICLGDGYKVLCPFLNLSIIHKDFPYVENITKNYSDDRVLI